MRKVALLALVALGVSPLTVLAQSPACEASHPHTPRMIQYIKQLITPTSNARTITARTNYTLTAMADSATADTSVVQVTSDSICSLAATPYAISVSEDSLATPQPVTVLRVGASRYVVFSTYDWPKLQGHLGIVVLDSLYAVKALFIS